MLKKFFFVLCVCAALTGVSLYYYVLPGNTPAGQDATGRTDSLSDLKNEAALNLALKSISLSQGEGGVELWRLKAEWAGLQKSEDLLVVEKPRLTYFMKEDGKVMHISSDNGNIEQKARIIRFIDNVHITQDDKAFDGELLVYNGTQKSMNFPGGGKFSGKGLSGSAETITWFPDRRQVTAEGAVAVYFE
ncbi:MAG: LPS export ABC transporter periplasmic protein LptC [Desulfovibrio sp.]|nr:LPS export ABC transporter periplasmic protein LptC [Desulfovibrio sp.]